MVTVAEHELLTMSSLYSYGFPQAPDLRLIEHLWDVAEWEIPIMDIQMCSCVMPSC